MQGGPVRAGNPGHLTLFTPVEQRLERLDLIIIGPYPRGRSHKSQNLTPF